MDAITKKQFYKELKQLGIPLALQHLLTALVGASDALMLGRWSQDAIAAISLANQISFVMSLFTGAAIGAAGVLIAQYYGKRDTLNAVRFLSLALRYTLVICLIFFAGAFFFSEPLMRIFTPEESLIHIGGQYLKIVSFSYLFSGLAQCILMMMKLTGHAKISVWISTVTVLADMIIDFFLIYGRGPIPALGANGSAYSTVAVEVISLLWCLVWLQRKRDLRLRPSTLFYFSRVQEKAVWKIIPGMIFSSLSWGLSMTLHSFLLGHLGTDATAAASVATVAQQLIQCVTHGLSGAAAIMIGQRLGRNEMAEAKAYGREFWIVSGVCSVVNMVLLCASGALVYIFYVLEPLAKRYLVQMLVFSLFYMAAYAFNTIITCGVFPAGGDSRYDAISVFFATWCFALPLAFLGCFVFHWPVMTVYIVMCLDEIVKVPFISVRYKKYIWLKNLTTEEA